MSDAGNGPAARVIVADDERTLLDWYDRVLGEAGYEVICAPDGPTAAMLIRGSDFDVIVADLTMPGLDGLQLLRLVRERDLDVPVILVTGRPSFETAVLAIEYGALLYLVKPVERAELLRAVETAVRLYRMAKLKRAALAQIGASGIPIGDRAGLEAAFARAIASLWMAYQPIVRWSTRSVHAHEALLRTNEPTLSSPLAVMEAAERLSCLPTVGRAARDRVAAVLDRGTPADLYVNLHPADLSDDALFDAASPLARHAGKVVLEITERATLDHIVDLRDRVAALRKLGFRIALDDLGAGYSGLTTFAQLEPEVVKVDMGLVRDVHRVPAKQKLIRSIASLCRDMGGLVIVEGVESAEERDALADLGCDHMQGYLFSRPGPGFPDVAWSQFAPAKAAPAAEASANAAPAADASAKAAPAAEASAKAARVPFRKIRRAAGASKAPPRRSTARRREIA